MPNTALSGVRNSWLIRARKRDFWWLARSAWSRASVSRAFEICSARSRDSDTSITAIPAKAASMPIASVSFQGETGKLSFDTWKP